MPSLPLPFVTALLLVILLVRLIGREEPSLRPAIFFVAACATLTAVIGLRWSFDLRAVRFVQPVLAAALPAITWFCFQPSVRDNRRGAVLAHIAPVALVAILSGSWSLWQPPIDLVLAIIYLGYGATLLWIGSCGPDGFVAIRFSDTAKAHKATLLAGLMLIGSGMVDLLIAVDLSLHQGTHAPMIVGLAHLLTLPLLAWAAAVVGTARPAPQPDVAAPIPPADDETPDDARIVETVDRVLHERHLFRDPDLTLDRLARIVGIPARQISAAINRRNGRNVSQWVNEHRIAEAKRLLASSDRPITIIMFEVGFQTKSNFNREFRRITGRSPSAFRRALPETNGRMATE